MKIALEGQAQNTGSVYIDEAMRHMGQSTAPKSLVGSVHLLTLCFQLIVLRDAFFP